MSDEEAEAFEVFAPGEDDERLVLFDQAGFEAQVVRIVASLTTVEVARLAAAHALLVRPAEDVLLSTVVFDNLKLFASTFHRLRAQHELGQLD